MSGGCPHYSVSDGRDICPISCSYTFVDDPVDLESPQNVTVLMGVGSEGAHGGLFVPHTVTGAEVKDSTVYWVPTNSRIGTLPCPPCHPTAFLIKLPL